jgi:hypothetical protein
VFYLDVAYVFIHMLQAYFLDVSSADVCCIQVFLVARISCFSESQGCVARHGRWEIGRDELVAGERGALGAGSQGHDGAGQMDGGRSNRGERGELRASHTNTMTARCACGQGELADER